MAINLQHVRIDSHHDLQQLRASRCDMGEALGACRRRLEWGHGDLVEHSSKCVCVGACLIPSILSGRFCLFSVDCEEDMLTNLKAIRGQHPSAITWLYRNGVKALPWFT